MKAPVPVLRIFDEAKAKEFYVGFLGFVVDWEHRFGDGFPLYLQVSRGNCVLHLSAHHGDACPGASLRIETPGLGDYIAGLRSKGYMYAKPGEPKVMPWGCREICITDPFGCRVIFWESTNETLAHEAERG